MARHSGLKTRCWVTGVQVRVLSSLLLRKVYMYKTSEKRNDSVITIVIDYKRIAKGHQPHQSGSGKHLSKKVYKRNKKVEVE